MHHGLLRMRIPVWLVTVVATPATSPICKFFIIIFQLFHIFFLCLRKFPIFTWCRKIYALDISGEIPKELFLLKELMDLWVINSYASSTLCCFYHSMWLRFAIWVMMQESGSECIERALASWDRTIIKYAIPVRLLTAKLTSYYLTAVQLLRIDKINSQLFFYCYYYYYFIFYVWDVFILVLFILNDWTVAWA